jgi:hypothetical protein
MRDLSNPYSARIASIVSGLAPSPAINTAGSPEIRKSRNSVVEIVPSKTIN